MLRKGSSSWSTSSSVGSESGLTPYFPGNSSFHNVLLKYLYQVKTVSGHVFLKLFARFRNFRQMGSFCFSFYFYIPRSVLMRSHCVVGPGRLNELGSCRAREAQ